MMKVTSVSGTTINYDTTLHMLNGSQVTGTGSMNVGNGMNTMSGYNPMGLNNYYFMSSNIGMMGKMYATSSTSPTINDTVMMNYAGGQRTTNHMSLTNSQSGMMNQSDYYFDQATGVMVQWHQQYIQTNGNFQTNGTRIMNLQSSSVWAVPEFTGLAIIPFVCVMTALVFILKKRKLNIKAA